MNIQDLSGQKAVRDDTWRKLQHGDTRKNSVILNEPEHVIQGA